MLVLSTSLTFIVKPVLDTAEADGILAVLEMLFVVTTGATLNLEAGNVTAALIVGEPAAGTITPPAAIAK
jgi:hypothetical protein